MNINNLFQTTGTTGNNGSMELTNSIQNIPITTETFPDSYYLGYMKHWFSWQKTTQATYNAETNEISFTDITDYSTYPSIGYGAHIYSTGMWFISNYVFDTDLSKFIYTSGVDKYLLNNFHPQATSMRNLALDFVLLGIDNDSYAPHSYVTFTSIADFLDFYNDIRSITLTDSYNSRTYTIYRRDLTNDGYYDTPDNTRFVLKQGYFDSDSYYDDNSTAYTNFRPQIFTQSNYKILNETKSSVTFGENNSVEFGTIGLNIYNQNPYMYKCLPKTQTQDGNVVITVPFIGHLDGTFIASEWFLNRVGNWDIIDSNNEGRTYIFNERYGSAYPVGLLWQETIEDVYKNASLYRWTTSNVYGYSDDVAYYPTFNPDDMNEFTLGLQTGTQSDLQSLLPLWYRLDNAQASEYTDSDKPTPEDEDDTDPEPDIETGVIVSNNFTRPFSIANQFVTTYVMTGAQLSNLGRILWTSFNDDTVTMDMVENFWANVQQATGTWDISAVMNFFISLTMFPFDVTNLLPSTSLQSASELFLGTGKLGLDIKGSSNLYVANYAVGIADLGTVAIPETYGDYRDYVNTVISVYLPYCGTVQLNPSDVVGKSISCKYAIDINSGECTAFLILVDNNVERYNLAIEKGMCGFSIPITSTNSAQVKTRLENNMLKSGSAMLSMLQGGLNVFETALKGDAFDIGSSALGFQQSRISSKMLENSFLSQSGIGCNYISGATGFSDLACPSTAYVQIKRGIYSKPMHYKSTVGYSTNAKEYGKISNFSGYIKCVNADVSGMTCTEEEKSKIKLLLESGVYV